MVSEYSGHINAPHGGQGRISKVYGHKNVRRALNLDFHPKPFIIYVELKCSAKMRIIFDIINLIYDFV